MMTGRLGTSVFLASRRSWRAALGFTPVTSFFFRQLPSKLTERNSTDTCHMFGSEWRLKMHVHNFGCYLSLKIWCPKTS